MHDIVREKLPEIQALCRSLPVRRLELFGSAARGSDFNPETSDVDVLLVLDKTPRSARSVNYFHAYMTLRSGLERIFNRPVDVLSGDINNPYLRRSVLACKELLYEFRD